jgi:hypothetical protein
MEDLVVQTSFSPYFGKMGNLGAREQGQKAYLTVVRGSRQRGLARSDRAYCCV